MFKKDDLKKAFIVEMVIIGALITLFFISKSNGAIPPNSATFRLPTTNSQTHTEVWASLPTQITGAYNNENRPSTNQCGSAGQYNVVKTIKQNSADSFYNVTYWRFDTWIGILVGTTSDVAPDWLLNPPTYDLNCWTTEPQIRWRDSP